MNDLEKLASLIDAQVYLGFLFGWPQRERNMKKNDNLPMVRVTYYIPEYIEDMVTEIYIKRLKGKHKTSRSCIISDAIKKFYQEES